jgi:hypothetical protein
MSIARSNSLGQLTTTVSNTGQLAGMRNRIINGGMKISQRGSVAASSGYAYTADRFRGIIFGGTGISGNYNIGGLTGSSTGSALYLISSSFTNGAVTFDQAIESANCIDLNSNTVTVSGKYYQDTGSTQSIVIRLSKANSIDNFSGETTLFNSASISVPTNSVTKISASFSLGATDASNGVRIAIIAPSLTVTNKSFAVADLQLELGTVATPFEQRPYGLELALCQRYYWQFTGGEGIRPCSGLASGFAVGFPLKQTMRVSPTISTNITDANFTNSGQVTGANWGLQVNGLAIASKTGTASISISYSVNDISISGFGSNIFNIATNAFIPGSGIFVTASAEL